MRKPRSAAVKSVGIAWRFLLASLLVTVLCGCRDATGVPSDVSGETSHGMPPTTGPTIEAAASAATQAEPTANAPADSADEYPLQDNPLAGCSLCHVDVEDEFVPTRHFKEKVGCKTCHGPSAAHLADENNEIKPDELFTRKNVDQLCERCHECDRHWTDETPASRGQQPLVCTDCHGHHTLALKRSDALP